MGHEASQLLKYGCTNDSGSDHNIMHTHMGKHTPMHMHTGCREMKAASGLPLKDYCKDLSEKCSFCYKKRGSSTTHLSHQVGHEAGQLLGGLVVPVCVCVCVRVCV